MVKFENVAYFKDINDRANKRTWMRSITRHPDIKPVAQQLKFLAVKDIDLYHKEFKQFATDLSDGLYGDIEDATVLGYLILANYEFEGDKVFDDFISVLPSPDSGFVKGTIKGEKRQNMVYGINKAGKKEVAKIVKFKRFGKEQVRFYGTVSKKFISKPDSLKQLEKKKGF